MKKVVFAVLALALIVAPVGRARAGGTSEIRMTNQAKDAWVWVVAYQITAYGQRTMRAAYCVDPAGQGARTIDSIVDEVRVEVMGRDCGHQVYLDSTLKTGGSQTGGTGLLRAYIVRGSVGRYAISLDGDQ